MRELQQGSYVGMRYFAQDLACREIIPDRDSIQRDIGDEHGLYLLPQLRCLSHGLSADDLGAIRVVLWNSIMSNCFCCLDGDRLVASVQA